LRFTARHFIIEMDNPRPSVSEIARNSGLSPRTIFARYKTLGDLYADALGPEGIATLAARLRAMSDDELLKIVWGDRRYGGKR
jgi:AcrR family transcriptional regulator